MIQRTLSIDAGRLPKCARVRLALSRFLSLPVLFAPFVTFLAFGLILTPPATAQESSSGRKPDPESVLPILMATSVQILPASRPAAVNSPQPIIGSSFASARGGKNPFMSRAQRAVW